MKYWQENQKELTKKLKTIPIQKEEKEKEERNPRLAKIRIVAKAIRV